MNINKICILGPFNSGTNLITKMLLDNMNRKILLDPEGARINGCAPVWKHAPEEKLINEGAVNNPNTLFICIYRPMINWISSIKRNQYGIVWDGQIHSSCRLRDTNCNTIMDLHTHYFSVYKNAITKYKNVIFMNYDNLIDILNIYEYINNKLKDFDIHIKNEKQLYDVLNKPSKDHGNCVNDYKEAKKRTECVMNINKREKEIIEQNINLDIVDFFEK